MNKPLGLYNDDAPSVRRPLAHTGSFHSYIDPSQIFIGEYWDEFAIPLILMDSPRSALVLGLGAGAGIRPMLAVAPDLEIVGVDVDHAGIARCTEYFDAHLPSVQFDAVHCDAREFVRNTSAQFDVVWVDLFTKDGYAPCVLQPGFFYDLAKLLTPSGVCAINLAGCPVFLNPLECPPISTIAANALAEIGTEAWVLPYRRNVTLLAGMPGTLRPVARTCSRVKHLSTVDRDAVYAIQQRVSCFTNLRATHSTDKHGRGSFTEIAAFIDDAWREYKTRYTEFLCDLTGDSHARLSVALEDGPLAFAAFRASQRHSDAFAAFGPCMLASRSAEGDGEHGWFIGLVAAAREHGEHNDLARFKRYALTQAHAIMLHRHRRAG